MRAKLMRKIDGMERELKRLRDEQAKKLTRIDHLESALTNARAHADDVQVRCDAALSTEHGKAGFIAVADVAKVLTQHLHGDSTALPRLTTRLRLLAQAAVAAGYMPESALLTCQEACARAGHEPLVNLSFDFASLERRVLAVMGGVGVVDPLMEILAREQGAPQQAPLPCACVVVHNCGQHPTGTPVTPSLLSPM